MEIQILDAMKWRKKEIETKALIALWNSRVEEMGTIVKAYQRTFNPHDFYPSVEDVCRIPDIRQVIMGGTDEEFNACAEEVTSRLPELTSQFLEERTEKLSALIPFSGRADLSLATVWFKCRLCRSLLIHGEDALKHECLRPQNRSDGGRPVGGATFDNFILRRGWFANEFIPSDYASAIARAMILECGENPESITLDEVNSKLYRFFINEDGERFVYSWMERVSFVFS